MTKDEIKSLIREVLEEEAKDLGLWKRYLEGNPTPKEEWIFDAAPGFGKRCSCCRAKFDRDVSSEAIELMLKFHGQHWYEKKVCLCHNCYDANVTKPKEAAQRFIDMVAMRNERPNPGH